MTINNKNNPQTLELANDSFYVKLEKKGTPCKFAYIHLGVCSRQTFLALFDNSEVENPIIYMWEEEEKGEKYNESRRTIVKFLGEVYDYLVQKIEGKPITDTLWHPHQAINCAINPRWWNIIDETQKKILGNKDTKC